jgi:hypothetical protein
MNFPFAVLLTLGVAATAATLWEPAVSGAPTRLLLPTLIESFQLGPAVTALFFAGEIYWSESAHRVGAIIGSTPAPPTVLAAAKSAALALLLVALAIVTGAATAAIQIVAGQVPDVEMLLGAYVFPKSLDWLLFGVLALFLQALAPNKLAGWGLLVVFLISGLALDQAGLDDPLYRFASYPGAPFPPQLSGEPNVLCYRLQWCAVALLMVSATLLLFRQSQRR